MDRREIFDYGGMSIKEIGEAEVSDTDLISRQAAIQAMAPFDTNHELRDTLEGLPSERPKGEWIKSYFNECCGTDENHNPVFRKTPCVRCDQCGEKRRNEEKFCPNCGADMRGDKE